MIKFSVKHPVTMLMFIGILVVLGVVSVSRMGLDLLPEMTFPAVTVVTQYPNVAPEDVEALLTKPLESVVSTVSGIKDLTSISVEGSSMIIAEFEWGTNLDFAAQDIRDKIALIERRLPADVEKPIVFKFDVSSLPVGSYIVTSGKYNLTQLKKLIEDEIKPYIERVDGVASANVSGGNAYEYWVEIDLPKMISAGINFSQIYQMLQLNNYNFPSGKVDVRQKSLLIRTIGEYEGVGDLENQVVGFRKNGLPVFLREVGHVYITESERTGFAKHFNEEVIMLSVNKRSGANTVQVVDRVDKSIEEIAQKYSDINIIKGFDQAKFIRRSASETINSAILGALLAAIIVFIFLLDLRPTLVIGLAIPLSVIMSFTILYFLGYTLNMMTLAGIALGVGMLVDASVVVVENIFRREESGESRIDAAINGTEEVWIAISASTFTNIVVFLPLIYIGGLVGQFTQPVAVTVTVTLLASLLVAVTVIPVFISSYITQSVALKEMRKKYWFTGIRDFYERILRKWILPKRGLVIGIAIFLFIASIPLIKVINTEFIPPMDASNAVIQVELPMGTNLKETEHYVNQIIDIASPYPEVERVMAQGGSAGGAVGGESYIATVTINLVDANKRERSADEIVNDILSKVPKYEGGVVKSMDLVNVAVLGGAGKPVEISIFGNDLQELNLVANMVEQELLKIRGITNTEISLKKAKPELRVHINRAKAAYYGFTPVQIQRELQMAFQGVTASNLRLSGDEYNLILKADTTYLKEDIEKLQYFPLLTVAGTIVPLKEVADLVYDYGLVRINRENQSRVVKVLADIEGRTTNEVFSDIRSMLSNLSLPEGFSMQLEGEFEQIQDMMKNLGISIIAAILLIYMVLAAQFESFKDPFVVLFSIPLSFIGVILALLVTGTSISIPSLLGVLILVGVTVNQALVMVTFYKELRVQGMEPFEAIVRGSVIRIRAIFITNLTTILGLIPMALSGHTEGGAIRAPLAISIIGGLIASTFLSLLVIPVIYSYFEKIRVK